MSQLPRRETRAGPGVESSAIRRIESRNRLEAKVIRIESDRTRRASSSDGGIRIAMWRRPDATAAQILPSAVRSARAAKALGG
jgi:hypothetical protein